MKTIETERLILRGFRLDDVADVFEYASVPGVGEMAGWPHHESMTETNIIVQEFIASDDVYAIELKENHKVIGSIGVHRVNKNIPNIYQKELGYVLSKNYWHQGYASEATKAVIIDEFENEHLDILWCSHFDFNEASKRLIIKNGFVYQKTFEEDIKALNFKRHTILLYYMDPRIYNKVYKKR